MNAALNAWNALRKGFLTPVVLVLPLLPVLPACDGDVLDTGDEPGEQILFLSTRVGAMDQLGRPMRDIYRMDANGEGVENLTRQPAWAYRHLSLSPDGNRIAFSYSIECDIRVMDTDGSDPTRLTNQDGVSDDGCNVWPRWSPDGTRIAFATNRERRAHGGVGGLYDAYVMNADGSNPRNVSHSVVESTAMNVAVLGWSPAGQIVFEASAFLDGDWHITVYVVNPDGTGLRPLFDNPGDHSPAWSPDGSQIVFISERDGRRRLYIMNADGSGVRPLTSHAGDDWLPGNRSGTTSGFAYDPWSPDGNRIAFDRDAPDESGTWVINADGSSLRRLTDHPTWFNGWSPAGTRIAFTSRRIPMDVYVINPDGSGLLNLTRSPHDDSDALWIPRQ
jgi:TolB protein